MKDDLSPKTTSDRSLSLCGRPPFRRSKTFSTMIKRKSSMPIWRRCRVRQKKSQPITHPRTSSSFQTGIFAHEGAFLPHNELGFSTCTLQPQCPQSPSRPPSSTMIASAAIHCNPVRNLSLGVTHLHLWLPCSTITLLPVFYQYYS